MIPLSPALSVGLGILIVAVVLLIAAIRILREYERGVVFFLGRFQVVKPNERVSTIVFPVPIDVLGALSSAKKTPR